MPVDRGNLRTFIIVAACLVGGTELAGVLAGWVLVALGVALHVWSKGILRQNRELSLGGPYRYSRNPFYLANLLIDLGIVVVSGRWWLAAAIAPLWFWIYRGTILREEQNLTALFGDRYREYQAAVPRFWPRFPAAAASGAGFSWGNPNLASGSEYARALRALSAPLLVWVACEIREEGLRFLTDFYFLDLGALTLLGGLRVIESAIRRRQKHCRGLLPEVAHAPAVRLLAITVVAIAILTVDLFETDLDPLSAISGTLGLATIFGAAVLVRPFSSPHVHVFEAAVCLLAAWTAGLVWLGIPVAALFVVLAVDPRCACERSRIDVPTFSVGAALLLLVAVGFTEELIEAAFLG